MTQIISLTLILALLLTSDRAQASERIIPSDKAPLSDDFVLYLQVERTLRRENLIKRVQSAAPTPGFLEDQKRGRQAYSDALKNYEKSNYATARAQFEQALLVMPESDQLYFDYGKCLYRQGAYRMALSVFMILENSSDFTAQSEFYEALSLFKLKNYKQALQKFNSIVEDENSDLSPTSAFYSGQIEFRRAHYPQARKHFEFVLDKSKDPQMDDSAEKYLEQITQQEKLALRLSKRFGYTLNIGLMYDQNVLNISQQNSATSLEAYRASYGGSLYYHVMNESNQQLSPTIAFSDMYSVSNQFKNDTTIQSTDPFILDLSMPYSLNFLLDKKSAAFLISPGVEQIYMTKDTTTREVVFNNLILNTSLTIAHSNYLTTAYKLYLTREQSTLTEASPDDSQTQQKYMATISNYYLLDKASNANAILDLSYLLNKADGKNVTYNKYLISLGYYRTVTALWNLFVKTDYYNQDYNESTTGRKDSAISGYVGGTYNLTTSQLISLGLQYQNNSSNVESYKYNKFIFTTMYTLTSF